MNIKTIIILTIILTFDLMANTINSLPYSVLSENNTKKLECVFNKYLLKKSATESLIQLDIVSADSIENLFKNNSYELDIYKAFVLDYYYQSNNAHKYYKNAFSSSKKNANHYIYYLARTYEFESATSQLNKISIVSSNKKINYLIAMIYIAHGKDVPSPLVSKFQRDNTSMKHIERIFYECN